ncbi:hypothetical protein [Niabella beijingensis]|uniref:hypothetical protein n=1 Tax=Niabella beijingensis TaxID=2872700 RepID=UPI001CBB9F7C|nr:hypothetical protein [Niabella beijingensis]MBZ4191609.1 hypothetical protein [Niabella beijingensis]
MFKVLVASEGATISPTVFEFIKQMNRNTPVLLSGLFLPKLHFIDLLSAGSSVREELLYDEKMHWELVTIVYEFINFCKCNNINYTLYSDSGQFELPELQRETRFADLLIIGEELLKSGNTDSRPGKYLEKLLQDCECPVVVIPEKYTAPTKNIIAFDGSEAAVLALKQFSHLLPGFAANETLFVAVSNDSVRDDSILKEGQLTEVANSHYPFYRMEPEIGNMLEYFSGEKSSEKAMIVAATCTALPCFGAPMFITGY